MYNASLFHEVFLGNKTAGRPYCKHFPFHTDSVRKMGVLCVAKFCRGFDVTQYFMNNDSMFLECLSLARNGGYLNILVWLVWFLKLMRFDKDEDKQLYNKMVVDQSSIFSVKLYFYPLPLMH